VNRVKLDGTPITPSKIVCVGKNYVKHIQEMGGSKPLAEPTIFMKPNSSIAFDPGEISVPVAHGQLHHEVELCFLISKLACCVDESRVMDHILGWGIGIDFTLREIQSKAKKSGGPWTISKCFDNAAVFGAFTAASGNLDPKNLKIVLSVNGEVRQSSNTENMIFSPSEVVAYMSRFITLEEGDIVMMGTPEGVGEVVDGDRLEASIQGLPELKFSVRRP